MYFCATAFTIMLIKKKDAKCFANSSKCTAYEYDFKDKDLNVALIEINGRYPETGRVVNEVCKEIVFVLEGAGSVIIEGKEFKLEEGDQVLIKPKHKYFFDGSLKILTPCVPAWFPEQHKEVS